MAATQDQLAARGRAAPPDPGVAGQGGVVLAHRLQNPISENKHIRKHGFTRGCHAVRDTALRGDTPHNGAAVLDRHEPGSTVAGTEGSTSGIGRHKNLFGGFNRRNRTTKDGHLPLRQRRSIVPAVRCHSSHPARGTRKFWQPDRLENEVDRKGLGQLNQRNIIGLILIGGIVGVDEHTAIVGRAHILCPVTGFCLHVALRIGPGIGEFAKSDIGRHAMGSGQNPLRIDHHTAATVHPYDPGVFVVGLICAANYRQGASGSRSRSRLRNECRSFRSLGCHRGESLL